MSVINERPRQAYWERFVALYNEGRKQLTAGIELDEKSDKSDVDRKMKAVEHYREGLKNFESALKINLMDSPPEKRDEMKKRVIFLEKNLGKLTDNVPGVSTSRVDSPKRSLSSDQGLPAKMTPATRYARVGSAGAPSQLTTGPEQRLTRAVLLKGVDEKLGNALLEEIMTSTGVRLADVVGAEDAKLALEEAVILPALNPELFSGLRQPVKGILLFGPPGNGKTLLAKAVANESRQVFLNISASSLMSKWVGDAEKTIRALFQIARNAQPSIVFIDEIDSILMARSEKDSEVMRRVKTEFLLQFDGAATSTDERVLVIGATNRPQELDDAVLRRFPKRIMIPLPDADGRVALLKATLIQHNLLKGLHDSDIRAIASKTHGYSNSDLVALCKEAAMVPVRALSRDQVAKADANKLRTLRVSDFEEALRVIRPSTNEKALREMQDFARRAGQGGT